MLFAALFYVYDLLKLKTEGRRKNWPQSYKTQIKILPFPRFVALNNPAQELRV